MDELIKCLRDYQKKYNRLVIVIGMEIYTVEGKPVRIMSAHEEIDYFDVISRSGD